MAGLTSWIPNPLALFRRGGQADTPAQFPELEEWSDIGEAPDELDLNVGEDMGMPYPLVPPRVGSDVPVPGWVPFRGEGDRGETLGPLTVIPLRPRRPDELPIEHSGSQGSPDVAPGGGRGVDSNRPSEMLRFLVRVARFMADPVFALLLVSLVRFVLELSMDVIYYTAVLD